MKAESVGEGRDFVSGSVLVSICDLSSMDQSHLSEMWLHAGKQPMWRAKEEKCIG